MKDEADLYFAWCPCDSDDDMHGRRAGWYLIYPADDQKKEADAYVGPFPTFEGALMQMLEERP